MSGAIEYQTNSIYSEIPKIKERSDTYTEKTKYQIQMYNSIKYLNQILLFFYILFFTIIHVLILVQYLQGVKRDEIADIVWISIFFLYPYLIYYIEKTIYFCITYVLSLIYGKTYVYQFDQMLLFTDYYADPGVENNSIFK
jgi:hypothetical protein